MLKKIVDSSLVKAVYSDQKGFFSFSSLPLDSYLLEISALGYEPRVIKFNISKDHLYADLFNLQVGINISQLKEVVIVYEKESSTDSAILANHFHFFESKSDSNSFAKIIHDTIEFNISLLETKNDDNLQSIVKKLPGITEDEEGSLSSEGEEIVKVLVDGHEYFGDNVQLALNNIPAEVIEKVQIIESSNISEGKKINIKLKKEKENVVFGDTQAGLGNKDRYQGKAIVNRFGKKLQLTAISDFNNINRTNIQFKKRKKLFEDPLESPIDPKSGITSSDGLGFNLNFNPDSKKSFTTSYLYHKTDRNLFRKTNRVFVTDDVPFDTFQENNQPLSSKKHELKTNYKHVFTLNESTLKTNLSFGYVHSSYEKFDLLNLFSEDLILTRSIENKVDDDNSKYTLGGSVDFKQPVFKKKISKKIPYVTTYVKFNHSKGNGSGPFSRKTFSELSVLTNEQKGKNNADNAILKTSMGLSYTQPFSNNQSLKFGGSLFYDKNNNNRLISTDNINFNSDGSTTTSSGQLLQEQSGNTIGWDTKIDYSRPLRKGKLKFNYNLRHAITNSERTRLNSTAGIFVIDTNASSAFEKSYFFQKPGLQYSWSSNKVDLDVGFKLQFSSLKGTNTLLDASIDKHFINPSSFANFTFHLDSAKAQRLKLSFTSSVVEPRIDQLQPITIFYSPTRLYKGNTDLDLEQRYKANISYLNLNQKTKSSFSTSISAAITDEKIYNELSIDTSTFIRTTQPVNGIFQYSVNGIVQWKWNIKKGGPTLTSSFKTTHDVTPFSYESSLTDENIVTNKENISFRFENSQQKSLIKYSISTILNNQKTKYPVLSNENGIIKSASITSHTHSGSISYEFFDNWTVGSALSYLLFSAKLLGNNQPELSRDLQVVKLDAYLQKTILHDKAFLRFYADDLFNQNRGLKARTRGTYIEREEIATLKRYYMISFLYFFSGKQKATS